MKKILVLTLVLAMASVAGATLQISVDGVQEPVESEIYVAPSETLVLDIWTDANIVPGTGEWNGWALVCTVQDASISGGVAVVQDAAIVIYDDAAGNGFPGLDNENGVWGMLFLSEVSEIPAGGTIYDEIVFHCEWAPNDVVITLYGTDDWAQAIPLDSVVVHQIPEPTTIALLGLGGLLLRRKK